VNTHAPSYCRSRYRRRAQLEWSYACGWQGDVQEDVPIDDDDDDREPEHAHQARGRTHLTCVLCTRSQVYIGVCARVQGEPHAPLAEPHAPLTEPHAPLTEPRAPLTDDRVTGHEHPAPAAEEHPEQCAPERPVCPCPVTASAARRYLLRS